MSNKFDEVIRILKAWPSPLWYADTSPAPDAAKMKAAIAVLDVAGKMDPEQMLQWFTALMEVAKRDAEANRPGAAYSVKMIGVIIAFVKSLPEGK